MHSLSRVYLGGNHELNDMKITGTPCPKCGKLYYVLPVCDACGWKDEGFDEWQKEQLELCKEFEPFLLDGLESSELKEDPEE